ncbi:TBC1 domain family member 31 [Linepithema humile]|uniref:TBC1 domain family member 31 n=1 Tax=Linepithema humile TaxID=83485 RepID=UPI000623AB70|nr:PREDICTED: TBC1 domain family member 31 [Linepithema humile]
MHSSSWNKLIKNNESYRYELKASNEKKHCTVGLSFTQIAFDHNEEYLIAIDTKGYLHCIELSKDAPYYKKLRKVGRATFLAFNTFCKAEILIGLDTGSIKIFKLHDDDKFHVLSGHKSTPVHVSFYRDYCVTNSRNEVIIWHLQSCSKAHQLKVSARNVIIKKAVFSNMGHIVVLYHNDTMQAWNFEQLDKDTKIDTKIFGIRCIRDFVFTKDGRAMIMASTGNISILNTYNWSLLKKLCLPENIAEIRQLSIVPYLLDGGANKIVALLSKKCVLYFCDINASSFLETSVPLEGIKKFIVSFAGRYIAYVDQEGCLNITHVDKIISKKCHQPKKLLDPCRLRAHKISDHLTCVRQSMEKELDMKRLMPILREFGEYPEKYRMLIWSTVLKLPVNKNAYTALMNKVTHGESILDILKKHPLMDRNKASLLAMTMNCLLQWCPLLVQSQFLPSFIFPFIVVFQKDPLLAFELILNILLNYCQKWFEYHPLLPLNILGIIENILLEADPVLLNTFCDHKITSSDYAWPLLQTAMSEVLSGDEWLILWDHLISLQKPSLLLMCVAAYNIYSRENIISLIKSSGDIQAFYSTQSHIRAKDLLKIAKRLDQEIPERMHPNRYLRDKLLQLNHTGPYPSFILKEYPKFLIDNSNNFANLKMQECNHYTADLAERRRLHEENKAFLKQIHEARQNEVQKCFREHISNHLYKSSKDSQLGRVQECGKCKEHGISNFENAKSRNYEKLQRDIKKLEYEVQSFLDALRPCRSKVDVS